MKHIPHAPNTTAWLSPLGRHTSCVRPASRPHPRAAQEHAARVCEFLHRLNERHGITSRREFVMTAFARQNWPGAADTRSVEGLAVVLLPVAIVIITAPARTLRQSVLEHLIDDRDGIDDQRIICRANPQPDQMEKIAARRCCGRDGWPPPLAISILACSDRQSASGLVRVGGSDAHVMPRHALHKFARLVTVHSSRCADSQSA